jgi:hypothetical protein
MPPTVARTAAAATATTDRLTLLIVIQYTDAEIGHKVALSMGRCPCAHGCFGPPKFAGSSGDLDEGEGPMRKQTWKLATLALVAVSVALAGGGVASAKTGKGNPSATIEALAKAEAKTVEYVGKVDGTDAYISLRVLGEDVDIYICDGAGLISWPSGKVKNDGSFAANAASGLKVAGTVDDSTASGTVTLLDGAEHAFTASLATTPAGLYQRRTGANDAGDTTLAATIVLTDGTSRGGQFRVTPTMCQNIKASAQAWASDYRVSGDPEDFQGADAQLSNYYAKGCQNLTGPLGLNITR